MVAGCTVLKKSKTCRIDYKFKLTESNSKKSIKLKTYGRQYFSHRTLFVPCPSPVVPNITDYQDYLYDALSHWALTVYSGVLF